MSDALEFTGERFTPECVREIWYEHWHRYAWVQAIVAGKRVLDAACGEGYGAALLASTASQVVAIDSAESVIDHAKQRYAAISNVQFLCRDVTKLNLENALFDIIVSFETLEHVHEQEQMILGFARMLAPGGVLVLSSPDKKTYSDETGFRNEHHVRELYRDELMALLEPHFSVVRLFGQKLVFQSAIWPIGQAAQTLSALTASSDSQKIAPQFDYSPLYFIVLCAQSESDLPSKISAPVSLFGDQGESVYKHYQHEIRKNMQAGKILEDMQRRLLELEKPSIHPWWKRLFQRFK